MDDVFALVKARSAEYRALTDAYDEEMEKAHNCGHGTPEMVEHLRKASSMAEEVREALRRYQEAVMELAARLNHGRG